MQIEIFKYQSPEEQQLNEIRTVEIDGEIWFVGSDVAKVLGYKNAPDALLRHCKPKGIVKHDSLKSNTGSLLTLINEPNVYRLVIKSKLPSAERFEEWIFEEVLPSIRKKGYYGKIDRSQAPNFYKRYLGNIHKIELNKYFSVISELFTILYSELENVGYTIPNKAENGERMMPDISVGKMFSNYLKTKDSEYKDSWEYYDHSFDDGRPDKKARKYIIEALPIFRKYVLEVWIPTNAQKYFKKRDPLALDYLPKLLGYRK